MITIKTPFIIYAYDYHEFQSIQEALNRIGDKKVSYEEFVPENYPGSQRYSAVFYVRGQAKEANKVIADNEVQE